MPGVQRRPSRVLSSVGCAMVPGVAAEMPVERCDECGFDAATWTHAGAVECIAVSAATVASALGRCDSHTLNERPDPQTWSPLECVDHIRRVFEHSRVVCESAIDHPDEPWSGDFSPELDTTPAVFDKAEIFRQLTDEADLNVHLFRWLDAERWEHAAIVYGMRWTAAFAAPHLCHELLHHTEDARC